MSEGNKVEVSTSGSWSKETMANAGGDLANAVVAQGGVSAYSWGLIAQTVPQISGRDIEEAFDEFEKRAVLDSWNEVDTLRLIKYRLCDAALEYYRSETGWAGLSYADFKKRFVQRFKPFEIPGDLQAQLLNAYQRANESVAEFSTRLKNLGDRLLKSDLASAALDENKGIKKKVTDMILTQFRTGLKRDILQKIGVLLLQEENLTLAKAEKLASLQEMNDALTGGRRHQVVSIDSEPICQVCDRKGHTAKHCPEIFTGCYGRGEKNHFGSTRPRNQAAKATNFRGRNVSRERISVVENGKFRRNLPSTRSLVVPDMPSICLMEVNRTLVKVLLDTGSSVSLVRKDLVDNRKIDRRALSDLNLISATGHTLRAVGVSDVTISVTGRGPSRSARMVVVGNDKLQDVDVLIGRDIMCRERFVISYQGEPELVAWGCSIPLYTKSSCDFNTRAFLKSLVRDEWTTVPSRRKNKRQWVQRSSDARQLEYQCHYTQGNRRNANVQAGQNMRPSREQNHKSNAGRSNGHRQNERQDVRDRKTRNFEATKIRGKGDRGFNNSYRKNYNNTDSRNRKSCNQFQESKRQPGTFRRTYRDAAVSNTITREEARDRSASPGPYKPTKRVSFEKELEKREKGFQSCNGEVSRRGAETEAPSVLIDHKKTGAIPKKGIVYDEISVNNSVRRDRMSEN